jgi:PAS domain S-box-containing protein
VLRNACAVLERYRKDLPFAALYAGKILEASFGIDDAAERDWPLSGEDELVRAGDAAVLKIATYGALVAGINPQRGFDAAYADFFRLVSANIAGAIAAVQALEEERRRAAALAELDRAKTTFFGNVSHEFRTPLTLMLGPLEDVLARELAPESRAQLEVVGRNGQRLLKLVNTLLDFARIEAGRAQAAYQPTDLAALTTDLASNFRSACERAGLRLAVDCPTLKEAAYVDPEMWEKIVLNLLSNAFKFTLHGEIGVSLRMKDHFELEVCDSGVGIPAQALPRVFERFHRVEDARGRSHEGSGIGLALVNELVKLQGGSIAVQSAVGKGTTFTVTIPKGRAHLPAERIKGETAAPGAARAHAYVAEALGWLPGAERPLELKGSGPRVLLADDNADLRDYARRLLAEHYDVEAVADGQAALEAARARAPQLVISDVMMPRLDGFGLIRELRADPALRAIPVILLSARAGEEARVEGLGKGADDYLVKPFSARELLVRAGTLLRAGEMRRLADEARAQFETLLNEAPLGVYLVDEDFRVAAVNPVAAPAFGDTPEHLVGRDFDQVIHEIWPQDYADEIVRVFRRTLETGEPHVEPERIEQRRDLGVTEYYEWRASRIPLPGGRKGVVCYFRDISKAVLAREALRDADSRKDEFIATLAHELRNPLAPLRSSLDMLKLAGTAPPADLAVGIMDRQLNHLVRLVDDLMEVSRITRGSVELRKERVRLDVALRNAMEAAEPMIRAGHHRLHLSLAPEPIVVKADPVRLAQIFGNLLNNAAKYSDDGGDITIETRREGDEAVVAISDTGEGIEPGQLSQLFKIFVRGNRSAGRNQSGLGIGLALVQRLVELHGGRVEARSEGRGKGSVFTVRLPMVSAHPAAASARLVEHPTMPPVRILLVDDNRDAADSLRMLLSQVGADVRVAHDGTEALQAFEACRPRMVLLDIGMPGMDGYEVARRLRALPRGKAAALVALTGWGQDEDRRRVREAGFDHHLVKPADFRALQSLIASIENDTH